MSRLLSFVCFVFGTLMFANANAHRSWLLPSATVLSAPGDWVTVDAAVSNELFYFNHVPLRLDNLRIMGPSGGALSPQNASTGKFRSTFDAELGDAGTYRIAVVNEGVMATYKEKGEPKRWRGRATDFAGQIPVGAEELKVSETIGRVETFVTAGKPTEIAQIGRGLEPTPIPHPNDLYAGEAARFRMLLDGKSAGGLKVSIISGGIRYRDQLNELQVTTDADGQFTVTWPEPGLYWINASTQDDRTQLEEASERRLSYTATLEVMAP